MTRHFSLVAGKANPFWKAFYRPGDGQRFLASYSSVPTLEDIEAAFAGLLTYDAVIAAWAVHDTSTTSMSSSRTLVEAVTVPDGPVGQVFDQKASYDLNAANTDARRPLLTDGLLFDGADDRLIYLTAMPSITFGALAIYRGTHGEATNFFLNGGTSPSAQWNTTAGAVLSGGAAGAVYMDGNEYTDRVALGTDIADDVPHILEWRDAAGSAFTSGFAFGQSATTGVEGSFIPICFFDEGQADIVDARNAAIAFAKLLASYLGLGTITTGAVDFDTEPLSQSDGTALTTFRAKKDDLLGGTPSEHLVIWLQGDSWTHRPYLQANLIDLLKADGLTQVASGWITANQQYPGYRSENFTYTGFTLEDASSGTTTTFFAQDSIDGHELSATGTTATASIINAYGTDGYLHYKDLDGTFRWRLNGGSWNEVACANSGNNLRVQCATGLDETVSHQVDIDLTGNTGTVQFNGYMATSPGEVGFEFNRIGNGSAKMANLAALSASRQREIALYGCDLFILLDGTNDQRLDYPLANFAQSAATIVDDVAAEGAGQGILICPPENGTTTGAFPMTDYGRRLQSVYEAKTGWELMRFDLLWDDYATENAAGNWGDTTHLSEPQGWLALATDIYDAMMAEAP